MKKAKNKEHKTIGNLKHLFPEPKEQRDNQITRSLSKSNVGRVTLGSIAYNVFKDSLKGQGIELQDFDEMRADQEGGYLYATAWEAAAEDVFDRVAFQANIKTKQAVEEAVAKAKQEFLDRLEIKPNWNDSCVVVTETSPDTGKPEVIMVGKL